MTQTSADQRNQLVEQRRKVDFDSYDVTVEELVRRVDTARIDIAPVYQRQFRWNPERQSRLIESVMLGIPVPPLFMATNKTADSPDRWEVVDGLQRLMSLVNFAGTPEARAKAGLGESPLVLCDLDMITTFEGCSFKALPEDIRSALLDRPLKVIVLNDKSELQVRYDLFERLNTGGISLTAQEIRECVFRGEFMDLLGQLAKTAMFRGVVRLPSQRQKDGTPEDYVLRFFAFHEGYKEFDHSVKDFLSSFTEKAAKSPDIPRRKREFETTFKFLEKCFPGGICGKKGMTPVNLFEGVAVGALLALQLNRSLKPRPGATWIKSPELRRQVTAATNSRPRVTGRIEFCRDRFLGR